MESDSHDGINIILEKLIPFLKKYEELNLDNIKDAFVVSVDQAV
jgi:hypothetical protein